MGRSGVMRGCAAGLGLVLLAACLACGKNAQRALKPEATAAMEAAPPAPEQDQKLAEEPSGGGAPVPAMPQKLIRRGSLQIEVKDFDAAASALGQMAKSLGGYVADTQVTRHDSGYRTGQIVLKIPAERFDSAGSSIRALGKVLSEQSSVDDVTKAYADLETRLKVKREELSRIREL